MRNDPARQRARELYAESIAAQGPMWLGLAGLVRNGFENTFIAPAIDALQRLVLLCGDALDDDEEGGS